MAASNRISPVLEAGIDKIVAHYVRGATTRHGGAILLRRSAVERIGGQFPEDVPVGTDWDLDQRLAREGLRKAFVPAARHTTPYPATPSQAVTMAVTMVCSGVAIAALGRVSPHFKGPRPPPFRYSAACSGSSTSAEYAVHCDTIAPNRKRMAWKT